MMVPFRKYFFDKRRRQFDRFGAFAGRKAPVDERYQEHIIEFQPFGRMHGHDAHGLGADVRIKSQPPVLAGLHLKSDPLQEQARRRIGFGSNEFFNDAPKLVDIVEHVMIQLIVLAHQPLQKPGILQKSEDHVSHVVGARPFGVFGDKSQKFIDLDKPLRRNIERRRLLTSLIQRPSVLIGRMGQLHHIVVREIDDGTGKHPIKRRAFVIVVQKFQIIDDVQNNGLLIKASRSVKNVRNALRRQRRDEWVGPVVRARENGKLRIARIRIAFVKFFDLRGDRSRFVVQRSTVQMFNAARMLYVGMELFAKPLPQLRFKPVGVVRLDELISRIQNALRRTIVFREDHLFGRWIILFELQNVRDRSAAEFID